MKKRNLKEGNKMIRPFDRNKLLLSIGVLIVSVMMIISFTYAYWDRLVGNETEVLNIGEGVELVVEAVAIAPEGKTLIPETAVMKPNDVKSIILTYNVRLDKSVVNDLELTINASNVKIGGLEGYSELVNIVIDSEMNNINDSNILVSVTISLLEPDSLEDYEIIKNQEISFDLIFTAS